VVEEGGYDHQHRPMDSVDFGSEDEECSKSMDFVVLFFFTLSLTPDTSMCRKWLWLAFKS
jgi:hypothetical protein